MRDSARFVPNKGNAARNLSKNPGSAKFFIENITAKYLLALGIIAALALAAYIGLYLVIKTNETGRRRGQLQRPPANAVSARGETLS